MATSRKQAASAAEEDPSSFLGGRILIAMPGISDPRFDRAVILMCAHTGEQAMGITINRPLEGLSLSELFDRLGLDSAVAPERFAVLAGGPMERERGFVLHTDDYAASEFTLAVAEGVSLTATRDVLEAMTDADRRPRCAALALGCANWGPGQLEEELKDNVWLACDADETLIFGEDHENKWSRALAKIGVAPERLSAQCGRA
jgi:putative transcriptional regulator